MLDRLEKHIAKSSVIKIDVDVEGEEESHYGIPVLNSRTLLAFHDLDEFHFNGYRIVLLKYITRIRRGRFEVIQQKILKSIGELEKHAVQSWLRVGSWKRLLKSLKNKGKCACVASGLIKVNVFAIGEIHAIKDDAVILKSFDAHGEWYKPKHKIEYSDITEVIFDDEYSVTFNKYVRNSL